MENGLFLLKDINNSISESRGTSYHNLSQPHIGMGRQTVVANHMPGNKHLTLFSCSFHEGE